MNILPRFSLSLALLCTISLGTAPAATFGQSITNANDLYQYFINGGSLSGIPFATTAAPSATTTAVVATSTGPKIEDVVFQKNATPLISPTQLTTETSVALGDSVTVNLTSQRDPATPIDLFALAFDAKGFPTKRIFIKTVFNEEMGVLKKYRVTITQDLLTELNGAISMRMGYCLGGCLKNTARLIPGKILLPKTTQATTTQSYTSQTF